MAIKNLSIIGTDIDTLTATCEFALKQMSISVKSFFIDNKQHAIVFKETTNEEDPGRFPIDVTPVILREVIWRFLEQQPDDVYENLLSGYEEDWSKAWDLFVPDWYSKDHGIEHYDICSVLAGKPTIVEYGK